VLIVSAPIGEGHDLPARILARDVVERDPDAHAPIVDGLKAMGPLVERVIHGGSAFESRLGNWAFDLEYALISRVAPVRRAFGRISQAVGGKGLLRLIADERPDVVVSTYPGFTEVFGRQRLSGQLGVPLVSAITDLAALRYWAHPGVDLHLITHPESADEVRSIAGASTRVVAVRGLNDPAYAIPRARDDARVALGLPHEPKLVLVSGGGWGVGDLEGAVETALAVDGTAVVVICGRNETLQSRLDTRFAGTSRVDVIGFTDDLPDYFAAADALIHSTAGLTVLEAGVRGCPTISYGWGRGHIRANNRAYERLGLAAVARNRDDLAGALRRALAHRPPPDESFCDRPLAADVVLGFLDAGLVRHGEHVAQGA
jgi:UDP-N-acetylglucosamine:LPS N-acetylglucosamine transferase